MSKQFPCKQFSLTWVYRLNVKTVLVQTIQYISLFIFIWPIDWTLSSSTTPDQSGPRSDSNEGVLRIAQSSSISGASPADC